MANGDSIRIRHPKPGSKFSSLPAPLFFVFGVAKGDLLDSVEGIITLISDSTTTYNSDPPPPVFFGTPATPLPCGHTKRWVLRFGKTKPIACGRYSLTVNGLAGGAIITSQKVAQFLVTQPLKTRGPEIMYPAPNQDITAEASDFNAYGTNSIPLTAATVGDESGAVSYDAGSGYWYASFPPLTGTGELVFSVTDGTSTSSEYVVIDSSGGLGNIGM